jgi:hypothetical protein
MGRRLQDRVARLPARHATLFYRENGA